MRVVHRGRLSQTTCATVRLDGVRQWRKRSTTYDPVWTRGVLWIPMRFIFPYRGNGRRQCSTWVDRTILLEVYNRPRVVYGKHNRVLWKNNKSRACLITIITLYAQTQRAAVREIVGSAKYIASNPSKSRQFSPEQTVMKSSVRKELETPWSRGDVEFSNSIYRSLIHCIAVILIYCNDVRTYYAE